MHKIFLGYPCPIGLHYKGVYVGDHYPYFCLCALWGPYKYRRVQGLAFRHSGFGAQTPYETMQTHDLHRPKLVQHP